MTPSTVAPRTMPTASTSRWVMMALLFLSASILYIDRGSLSVAAPVLSRELLLSPVQLGTLLSAFFWSYTAFMLVSGWLVDRYPAALVFAAGYIVWSAATLLCGFAGGLASLMLFRLMLGAGESVALPSYAKMVAAAFPPAQRGLPTSLIEAGVRLGPAIGTFASSLLVASYGWRIMFWALGIGSLLWLVPWWMWAPKASQTNPAPVAGKKGPGIMAILRRRDAWGTFLGSSCYTYPSYFILTWLPSYLVNQRHVSMRELAVLGSLPYIAAAVTTTICGWLSDYWIKRGGSPTLVRKTFVVTGMLLSSVIVFATVVEDVNTSVGLIVFSFAALGIFGSNQWAITQTLAGTEAIGRWGGLKNTIASVSGIVAPALTGYIVQTTGGYFWAFALPAILAVIGASSYIFIIGKIEPVDWEK
jgi:ACS family D-galactonate transporter-like MFS transporter